MRLFRAVAASTVIVGLALAAPGALRAATPELLPQSTFDVRVAGGVVDVTFALALSEVPSYPVAITAVGSTGEELLWEGTLSEGFYRLQAPLTKITGGPLKVVLRTRITNRTQKGPENYIRYLIWEGSVNR